MSRVLDLFCCGGGAGWGYHLGGASEVVGVDIKPSPDYPFEVIEDDALVFAERHGREFDLIHASPPCQAYAPRSGPGHPDLLGPTIDLLLSLKVPFVVENVPTAPFDANVLLCGSMFGLRTDKPAWSSSYRRTNTGLQLRRHRKFRTNFYVPPRVCTHSAEPSIAVYGKNALDDAYMEAMGIPWATEWRTVAEAIPPAYTKYLFEIWSLL